MPQSVHKMEETNAVKKHSETLLEAGKGDGVEIRTKATKRVFTHICIT
jgi:hypothetical protein